MIIETSQAVELLRGVPAELSVMIIGMTPIFELRGAIPVALGAYKMTIWEAYIWSVLGNMVPVVFWVFFLEKISNWLRNNFKFWDKFFTWLFNRTRKKANDKIAKYGDWGLFFLVAIPLPITGGWTGALTAFLFGIKKFKAIGIIFSGVLTAGLIVSLLTMGVIGF
jgi:uncharacterized membrane protein